MVPVAIKLGKRMVSGYLNKVNSISSTPYKINIDLLNYLNLKGVELGLLMDPNIEDEYDKLDTLTRSQKRVLGYIITNGFINHRLIFSTNCPLHYVIAIFQLKSKAIYN